MKINNEILPCCEHCEYREIDVFESEYKHELELCIRCTHKNVCGRYKRWGKIETCDKNENPCLTQVSCDECFEEHGGCRREVEE